jgi:hypothetical protein
MRGAPGALPQATIDSGRCPFLVIGHWSLVIRRLPFAEDHQTVRFVFLSRETLPRKSANGAASL